MIIDICDALIGYETVETMIPEKLKFLQVSHAGKEKIETWCQTRGELVSRKEISHCSNHTTLEEGLEPR